MRIPRAILVRRLVLGLGLGVLLAGVVPAVGDVDLGGYGETINGQADFESAVVRELTLADGGGVRGFRDLTVYPATIAGDGGNPRPVHVVSGTFAAPPRPNPSSGRLETREERRCFVAAIPYHSRTAGGAEFGSVMDFLDTVRTRGVGYRYAWWCDPRWAKACWVVGGVLLLAAGWPGVVSLVRRTGVAAAPAVSVAQPGPTLLPAPVAASLDGAIASLEPSIDDGTTPGRPDVGSKPEPAAPGPRALSGAPSEPDAAAPAAEAKTYGAKADDYYPTERRKHGTRTS